MAMTGEQIKGLVRGLLATNNATDNARADQVAVKRFLVMPATLLTANTDGTFNIHPKTDRPIRVNSIKGISTVAQASAAADGWTLSVKYDDAAGGASSLVGSFATTAAAITANQAFTFTTGLSADVAISKRLFLFADATNTAVTANALNLVLSIEYEET